MAAGDGAPLQIQPCGDGDGRRMQAHQHGGGEENSQLCGTGQRSFRGLQECQEAVVAEEDSTARELQQEDVVATLGGVQPSVIRNKARRLCNGLGGGMRQVGVMAAGILGLQDVAGRIGDDHRRPKILAAGNHCHDIIQLPGGVEAEVLGGSVSYIGNVFDALSLDCRVVSKVGPDFAYAAAVGAHPPRIVLGSSTTQFFADLRTGGERTLRAGNICEQIFPEDIPTDCRYQIGLVVGVAGEIRAETLERIAATSGCVVVDVQALIRTIDSVTGAVGLRRLEETSFYGLLDRISFLKAASSEAAYLDLDYVRKRTCVIVTEGRKGSRVYRDNLEIVVPPFAAEEVDRTGAGDSFLAGFCAGLLKGLSVDKAVLMGNYFGALAVGQVGVPRFSALQLQIQAAQKLSFFGLIP